MSRKPATESDGTVEAGVAFRLLPYQARFSLRAGHADLPALSAAFGIALPIKIGTMAEAGPRSALCLGPDEWLLYTDGADKRALQDGLRETGSATGHSLVDVSDRDRSIEITGPRTREMLSTGCPRDMRGFLPNSGTRTVFASVPVVLVFRSMEQIVIECPASHLEHLMLLLTKVEREFASGL